MANYMAWCVIIMVTSQYLEGARVKKCANLFDESCINNGVRGSGLDEEWLGNGGGPGKRNLNDNGNPSLGMQKSWYQGSGYSDTQRQQENQIIKDLTSILQRKQQKRCANLFDEGCINGGVSGSGLDEEWLHGGPGKR